MLLSHQSLLPLLYFSYNIVAIILSPPSKSSARRLSGIQSSTILVGWALLYLGQLWPFISSYKTLEQYALANKISYYSFNAILYSYYTRLNLSCVISPCNTLRRLVYKSCLYSNIYSFYNVSGVLISDSITPLIFLVLGLTICSAIY